MPVPATASSAQPGSWATYKRLLGYALPHWKLFLISSLTMAVYAATDTGFAALLKPMLDESFIARDPEAIRNIPLLLMGLFLLRGITGFISSYGMNWVGRQVIQMLRGEMFARLLHLPNRYYDSHPTGQLVAKLIYNVEQVSQASTNAITILIRDSLTVIFLLAWMFYLSGWLALLFLVVGPVLAVMTRYVTRRYRKISRRIQDSMADVTECASEAIEGHKVVKAFDAQDYEQRQFDKINRKNAGLQMKHIATSAAAVPVTQFMAASVLAGVIYLATLDPMLDKISAGDFVSFIAAMMLLMPCLKRLSTVNPALQRGIAAAEGIFALLDEAPEADSGTRTIVRADGAVEFRNVGFRYRSEQPPVLQDLSFSMQPGQMVALVGRSGSGKSTLAGLLPRFYDVEQGSVLLDGVDIREYRLADLRAQIALVSQDVVLFNDTVANNIAYARPETSRADIERAARIAHAQEFIEKLPQGFDTLVGEKGVLLSGGQRQRLAIARALLKDAPILILDEATSALDTESERAIQSALETLMQGRSTLVIAHRLSTVEKADRILVMEEGRIVESGRHAELLAREGRYAALYRMQFRDAVAV
ncbi:MAG TPA: lipid A export permease/ATP-binding protein MsbA [Gammaproteobacteria bacterium]